ncbi:NAD(P)-binding protein [Exidia glandulosa HHB12029]|uniref:NAD(P)-binding protein n=1 Tax=Exidia glandulosa HHB12029 TaxID=1314781 RepID=A0A165GT61_EXIGL|nr:NAD(P)-binding protein [Exidia glandulosa HHB12029]
MAPVVMWIGLGSIGRAACTRLTTHGNLASPLLLYNRTQQRAHDLAAHLAPGTAEVVHSIAAGAARADIIFTCVSNDAAVDATYRALLENPDLIRGKILVGVETVHPATAERTAERVRAAGAAFVACPVLGPPAAAAAGALLAIPAGPRDAIAAVLPLLTGVLARGVVGPFVDMPAGTALRMKIIANTFTLGAATLLAEAFALADAAGLGAGVVGQFVEMNFLQQQTATNPFRVYADRMLSGEYYKAGENPAGAVELGIKDARLALELGLELGVPIHGPETTVYWAEQVLGYDGRGGGSTEGDIAGMYGAARKAAGLGFENGA